MKFSKQFAVEQIKKNTKTISSSHDSLVLEMLSVEKQKIKQKIKSNSNEKIDLNLSEVFNVIEEVTGVRPIILGNKSSVKQLSKSTDNDDNVSINLDVDEISLAKYASSDVVANYLKQVDDIKQDSKILVATKNRLISKIQTKIANDSNATINDIELFYNTTEILKGSLSYIAAKMVGW